MNNERLYAAIGAADDDLLSRCEPTEKGKRTTPWRRWGTMAACLCIVAIGAIIFGTWLHIGQDLPDKTGGLPVLTISRGEEAMGFEGLSAFDYSELVNGNPWNAGMNIEALPVYKNNLAYDENYNVPGADFDNMNTFLLGIAERLGMDTESLAISDNSPDAATRARITEKFEATGESVPDGYFAPTSVIAEQNGMTITVNRQMIATVDFTPAVALPSEYNFTQHKSSYEDMSAVAEYLKAQYNDLIGMNTPNADITGGDYTYSAQQGYQISFFESGKDAQEQIINYNFHRIDFYCDDYGELFLVRIYQQDLSEFVGDYPIITSDEALAALHDGYYITTVPYEASDNVVSVELVYRTRQSDEYYMPYYRFLIELPEERRDNGLKTYGAYYVPAVGRQYISDLTVWDGSFNS